MFIQEFQLYLRKVGSTYTINPNNVYTECNDGPGGYTNHDKDGCANFVANYNRNTMHNDDDYIFDDVEAWNNPSMGVFTTKVKNNEDSVYVVANVKIGEGYNDSKVDYISIQGYIYIRQYGLRPQEIDIDLRKIFNNA